jgi:hypothetical protein
MSCSRGIGSVILLKFLKISYVCSSSARGYLASRFRVATDRLVCRRRLCSSHQGASRTALALRCWGCVASSRSLLVPSIWRNGDVLTPAIPGADRPRIDSAAVSSED